MLQETLYPLQGKSLTTTTASSTQTAADFSDSCIAIEIYTSSAVHIHLGSGVISATNSGVDIFVEAGGKRTFAVLSARRVAAIADSAGGTVRITELVKPGDRRTPST